MCHTMKRREREKKPSACDCFCLKQQINDLLIFRTNMGKKESVWAIEIYAHLTANTLTHTHTLQKKIEAKKEYWLSWVQCNTKIPIDINAGTVLYQQQPKLPSEKLLLSYLSDILWVCVCVEVRKSERAGERREYFFLFRISLTRRHLLF